MTIEQRQLTLQEFLQLPEQKPTLEYERGRLIEKASPTFRQVRLRWILAQRINAVVEPARIAFAAVELRSTFAGHSYVPDVSVYRWDRIPRNAQQEPLDDVVISPDVAIEVVSPNESVSAPIRRCIWYTEHGVRAALLVDPEDRSVILFRPGEEVRALRKRERIELPEELPGFQLVVNDLFDAVAMP